MSLQCACLIVIGLSLHNSCFLRWMLIVMRILVSFHDCLGFRGLKQYVFVHYPISKLAFSLVWRLLERFRQLINCLWNWNSSCLRLVNSSFSWCNLWRFVSILSCWNYEELILMKLVELFEYTGNLLHVELKSCFVVRWICLSLNNLSWKIVKD